MIWQGYVLSTKLRGTKIWSVYNDPAQVKSLALIEVSSNVHLVRYCWVETTRIVMWDFSQMKCRLLEHEHCDEFDWKVTIVKCKYLEGSASVTINSYLFVKTMCLL